MGTASSQTRLSIKHLLKYLRVYSPDGKETDEEWSGRESMAATVGDVITVFKPTSKLASANDIFELEVDGVCLVFGEDADLPMNYFITDSSYEMSFLEGTLSAKANEAKEKGLSLYCLRSSLLASVGMQTKSKLGQMRKLGGSGDRKSPAGGLVEPLCQFFSALAIKYDPSMETEPLSALDLARALWGDDNQKSGWKGPDLDASFVSVEEENGGLNIDLTAVGEVAAEAPPQANGNGANGAKGSSASDGAAKMAAAEKDASEVWDMLGTTKPKPAEMKEESDLKSLFKKHSTGESKKMSSADALFGSSDDEIFASDDFFSAKSVDEMFGSSALASGEEAEAKAAAAESSRLKAEEEEAHQKAEEERKAAAGKAAQEAKDKEGAEAKLLTEALFQGEAEAEVAAAKSAEEAQLKAEEEAKAAELALVNAEIQAKDAAEKAEQDAKQKLEEETRKAEEEAKSEQSKVDAKAKAEEEARAVDLAMHKAEAEAKEAVAKGDYGATAKAAEEAKSAEAKEEAKAAEAKPADEAKAAEAKAAEAKAAEAKAAAEAQAAAAHTEEEEKSAAANTDAEAKSAAERVVAEAKEAAAKAEEEAKAKAEDEAKAEAEGKAAAAKAAEELKDAGAKVDEAKAKEDAKALAAKPEEAKTAAEKLVEEAKAAAVQEEAKAKEESAIEVSAHAPLEDQAKTDTTDSTGEVNSSEGSELKDKLRAQAKGNEDVLNRKDLPTRQKIELLLAKQKAAAAAKAKARAEEAAAESAKAEQKGAEDAVASPAEDKAISESKAEPAEAEDADESESSATDSISRPQKKLSLQATLAKLEEQSQKAHQKIDEFKKNHELACRDDLHLIETKSATFESDFKERLNAVRKEIVVKMRKLSVQATDKLSEIIDEGKVRIEERGPHSMQQLESVGKAVDLSSVDKELDFASSKFGSFSQERLSVLNLFAEGKDPLDAIVEEEIARIREWRATELQDYIQLFEKVSGRFESRVQIILSEIDGIAKSILDEIERLREFDTRRYEAVARELSEAIGNARRFGEMHARAAADNALSRKVFPALAVIKENLSKNANELRGEVAKKLDEHANQSVKDFDKIIDATKECFNKTTDELSDLKKTSLENESQAVDERLSKLQSHLNSLQEELRKSAVSAAAGNAGKENSFEFQAEEIGKNCSRDVAESFDRLKSDLSDERKAAASALKNSAEKKQSELTQRVKELFEKRKAARQDELKKLNERLDQLAESVDAISSQLIQ